MNSRAKQQAILDMLKDEIPATVISTFFHINVTTIYQWKHIQKNNLK